MFNAMGKHEPTVIDCVIAVNNQIRQAGFTTNDIDVEQLKQLSNDLNFFEDKNSSDVVAIKALTAAVSVENETLIAMSNCLHDSIINGLDAFVKRRIWRRKIKLINNRYEKRN